MGKEGYNRNKYVNRITWIINQTCNFHCNYCEIWNNKKQIPEPINTDKLSQGIDGLKENWHFHISGGEPFLENNFVELCRRITKKHSISIDTNLSMENVFDFADKIDPGKCWHISAAVHIAEREKIDLQCRAYIEKMLYLQKKGFNVHSVYVAHPTLLDRMNNDIEFMKSSGIHKVMAKIFQGIYKDKKYPSSYSPEQKEFLTGFEASRHESPILNNSYHFHGQLCLAGQKFFLMDRNGNLRRCESVSTDYGNFFEKSIKYDIKPKPCPKITCSCPPQGLEYNLRIKGNIFSILKEDYIERSIKYKNKKITKEYLIHKFWLMISALEKKGIPFSKIKRFFIKPKTKI